MYRDGSVWPAVSATCLLDHILVLLPSCGLSACIPGSMEMTVLLICEVQQEQTSHLKTLKEHWEAQTQRPSFLYY